MATKKTAWQKSEFGKIKWVNVFNAFYHAILVSLPQASTLFALGRFPTVAECYIIGSSVMVAFFGSLFKGMYTNSQGQPFKGEQ